MKNIIQSNMFILHKDNDIRHLLFTYYCKINVLLNCDLLAPTTVTEPISVPIIFNLI